MLGRVFAESTRRDKINSDEVDTILSWIRRGGSSVVWCISIGQDQIGFVFLPKMMGKHAEDKAMTSVVTGITKMGVDYKSSFYISATKKIIYARYEILY